MKRIRDLVSFESGSPQFRIKEAFDENAPQYTFYGQPEVEGDLTEIDSQNSEIKQLKTYDKVHTVETGDVVFSLISGTAAIVREIHSGFLFTQNYVKLVPGKDMDAGFLVYMFNEDAGIRKQFQMGMQGSITLKYTLKQVRELNLPYLPEMKKQKLIGELYFNQLRLNALRKRAADSETMIILEKIRGDNVK